MTNTTDKINQIIHEARGLCWHEDDSINYITCKKCGDEISWRIDGNTLYNPDYTSDWSAWGAALEWAQRRKWWGEFAYQIVIGQRLDSYRYEGHTTFNIDLLNPLKGATALAEFIDKHPEYFKKEAGK